MRRLSAFACGLLFGIGLMLAGMTDPAKVLGFLDIAGLWDPSLALVMAGAIGIALAPFAWARKLRTSLLDGQMHLPTRNDVDRRLILGSLAFGVGWGIAGICPGPALAMLGSGAWQSMVFVVAMLGGILIFELLERRRTA